MIKKSRLRKIAIGDYTNAISYKPEDDLNWSNIYSNIRVMPQEFIEELSYALENYSEDRSIYTGEHPMSICNNWKNQQFLAEQLNVDQMSALTMGIIPELNKLNL